MDFEEQLKQIEQIQKEFVKNATSVLLELEHSDEILVENIGKRFLKALLDELENDGEKESYLTYTDDSFIYINSRMDDSSKQQLSDLVNIYVEARKAIDNS